MPPPRSTTKSEVLRGLVDRVVFHNEDNGYCILKVVPEGRRDVVGLVGKAPRVVAGEEFEARGVWEPNRDFGPQFKADALKLRRPDSLAGIERYLGSGLIEGIGPKYAKRMVEKFGPKIFDIIENESKKLEEVEGVGTKRRAEIRESWMKQKSIHGIMLFLHQHGISSSRALRIYRTYGEDAQAVLKENPYRLAQDIRGIGFKTADDIAYQLGVAEDAPERIKAGILHVLETAAGNGHCCFPESEVVIKAAELLGVEALIAPQVEALISSDHIERHGAFLYLPHLRAAEQSIAASVKKLTASPAAYPSLDEDAALGWVMKKTGKELAESQQRAVREALHQRLLIITGGPGVGKTTILRSILLILQSKQVKLVLAAPTGRAAKRLAESTGMEAKTLHRLLEYQGDGRWGRHRGKPLAGDLFVVDEASMIDAPLMAQFLAALPDGAHLLIVGDADQLPSVGPGMVLHDLIASEKVPCVKLTEIFRQAASSRIITSAHAINRGQMPDLKSSRTSDFFFLQHSEPEEIKHTLVELAHTRLAAKYGLDPIRDIQVLTPMNRNLLGTISLNQSLQLALNPPNELKFEIERFGITFRVGDKVIQTHNNYDKEVFNGDIGHIVTIDSDPVKVHVRYDADRIVAYEPGELDELQLAYALSIHKSQGSEFPCVIIPVSTQHYVLLERSLIYTAITRAKKLCVLVGDERALSLAVSRQESRKRWTGLRGMIG
ncbi:SF1B family DNA helicase RecD2 [Prosthecobacter vanneervenii]|uniref:Exodeoxyribonuclease V alpha subunit n=1 Tax=Prosthecobacter vanneervenii TaxID=48466 RepID=A0A7W8DKC0_9BACT|nr:ATP-dependent RecD-like DNA helicase [Prosthecobacter vanneervenii]MBB5032706.1 exodeoxyribonuclease V alpha subunit [Prosthecobacter vanneervenii]